MNDCPGLQDNNTQSHFLSSETKTCQETEYNCGLPRNQCIPLGWHCDGKADCENEADEKNCSKFYTGKIINKICKLDY